MAKLLEHIRVLDLTQFLSGPFCTQLLAGMGAEVIKMEPPGKGASERGSTPFIGPGNIGIKNMSAEDLSLSALKRNRNKESVTLNLKSTEGKALFLKMLEKADVVMENFRPGAMEKLGLPYETLKKAKPEIIYCSIKGFGDINAYRKLPAFDIVVQAMCGLMSVNGEASGPPIRTSVAVSDICAGIYACVGILAAVIYRNRTGMGQRVDVSMIESALSLLMDEAPDFWATQGFPYRNGSRVTRLTPFNCYASKDGYYVIASGTDAHWQTILRVMGRMDLKDDPKYKEGSQRAKNCDEVDAIINQWSANLSTDDVVTALQEEGIPAAKVKSIPEVYSDKELIEYGSIIPVCHPILGKVDTVKSWDFPIHFSEDSVRFTKAAPILGSGNEMIYKNLLGLELEELADLEAKGII
ncbi:MAG: CoA transferase [Clostridiales Family XIII bacterium]|jgi:formyl-CoA transferase|nr:CoA transferase [Clostridiales Family XIII bacterium]